jgi:hypothetical protein
VTLVDLPVGTGAAGREAVRSHVAQVAAHLPADLAFARLSRTVDRFRVVDEERVAFLHDRELPWLLPGVAATGRRAEVLAISVATVRQGGCWRCGRCGTTRRCSPGSACPDAVQPAAVSLSGGEGPRGWW